MKEKLMILRIKKILLDYQKKERLADHEFVKEIVHIILKTYNLKSFIDEIVFFKTNKNECDAYYNPVRKKLGFSFDNVISIITKYENFKNRIMSNEEYVFANNVLILKNIFHEIEHVKQMKTVLINSDDLESKLLKLEFYDAILLLSKEEYDNNYLDSYKYLLQKEELYFSKLGERLAFLNSFLIIRKILNTMKLKETILCKKVNCFDYINNIKDFYSFKNPLYIYVDALNELNKNYEVKCDITVDSLKEFEKELKLEERFLYGFPISEIEFKKVFEKSKKSYK